MFIYASLLRMVEYNEGDRYPCRSPKFNGGYGVTGSTRLCESRSLRSELSSHPNNNNPSVSPLATNENKGNLEWYHCILMQVRILFDGPHFRMRSANL